MKRNIIKIIKRSFVTAIMSVVIIGTGVINSTVVTYASTSLPISDISENAKNTSKNNNSKKKSEDDVFKAEYFVDDNFRQLNVAVYVPELYALNSFKREVKATGKYTAYDNSVDLSHIETAYIAPVLKDGTTYMSIYDYTYIYSDDNMTAAFMDLLAKNSAIRKKLMPDSEYKELVEVYDKYRNSEYDVNAYVYHYIADYLDLKYGKMLFDYDFYCETYPILALLFNYDEEALKQHFYSIGMFEGRQGSKLFNVDNYNTSDDDTDLASYYIEYITSAPTFKPPVRTDADRVQVKLYDPAFESYVLDVTPDHHAPAFEHHLPSAYVQSELNAVACARARYELGSYDVVAHELMCEFTDTYLNKVIDAHDYIINHYGECKYTASSYIDINSLNNARIQKESDTMIAWRQCESHYKMSTNARWLYVGQGHVYTDYNPTASSPIKCKASKMYTMTFALYWDENSYFDIFNKEHKGF
ncbi:MAG: hypothetical protein MJ133_04440 [Lachnospiraceae bacterium]|nr:hypothetical protein [Lachnospiraceae bacterium]